ncbi:MAG TPA: glycosyltransferase family 87 protein [Terriglobales bacterium]|nr:glycosyltransferase family 87 protein [Terriglobales bacterium]
MPPPATPPSTSPAEAGAAAPDHAATAGEAQRRLGAAGPPSRREHKRDARRSRAGARANHWEAAFFALLAAAAAALALLRPDKAIDFHVYVENARHYFLAGAAMYGPHSGTGWAGGVYRYPPIFLDLFRPLSLLPLRWGAALWAVGKLALGGALAVRLRRRWHLASILPFWPALLLVAAYFIQELRYGNAQFYIVALVVLAFLADDPRWGGFWLGFAAALKVWPLFFFPCLVPRRRLRMLGAAVASGVGWTLLPVLWRGWTAQGRLLAQWLAQERSIAATSAARGELWYPGQSLHDVMARYLGVLNYSRLADARYVQVAWAHCAPATVERLWWAVVAVLLVAMFGWLWRAQGSEDGVVALLFCGVVVFEPHVHRLILETLLWSALWLASERAQGRLAGWRRALFWLAVAAAVAQPLVPGAARQRWLQVYGVDFFFVVVPLTAVVARQAWLGHIADRQARAAAAD